MLMNYKLRFVLLIFFIVYFMTAQEYTGSLSFRDAGQFFTILWSVGIFNNRNFSVQSKVSHFTYLCDNDNNNLATGSLILLNKIGLVLLLLN